MQRRVLLSALGTAAAAPLAGCVTEAGDGAAAGGSTETPTETPADADRSPEFDPGAEEPSWTVSIGDREGVAFPENNLPILARVWNDGPERDVLVTVTRGDETDAPLHLETVSLAADAFLEFSFDEPGDFALAVGVDDAESADDADEGDDAEPATVADYEPAQFDCNDTTTTVQVAEDGAVYAETDSSTAECPGAEVADVEFEQVESGDCGGEQSASVGVERDRVLVEGHVVTPVPCFDLTLEAVDYDPDQDRLTVDVAPDERHDGVCVECVGVVPYEATVAFEHAHPGDVRVRHREDDELVTVTSTSS